MADGDLAYLSGLSEHPDRPGDTSNFNPAFATPLANALRQANAQGLHLGVMSGYRDPGQTGSAYDAGGNSSHTYGLASDINGLDGPNGKITQQWAQIAQANGLHNPYGIGDKAEFNHWQLPAQPLEQTPQLLAALKEAKATGNMQNVWSAYNAGGAPSRVASATPGSPINDFYHTAMMHESGGKNIPNAAGADASGYYQFTSPTWASVRAAHPELNLPGNVADASQDQQTAAYHQLTSTNVAALQGANLPVNDKNVFMASFLGGGGATKFLTAMNQNPNAPAAGLFPAEAKANPTVFYANGQPRSLNQVYALQTGSFGTGNTTGFGPYGTTLNVAQNAPVTTAPGTASAGSSGSPASTAATSALPGFAPAQSNQFLQGASGLDKAMGGKGLEGQPGYGDGGQDQMRPSPMIGQAPAPHIPNAQAAAQTFGTTLNSIRTPLQWGSGTPGSPISATAGPQVAAGVPQGMTAQELQQMQQLQMMQMMGGGMGTTLSSPYGGGYG